MDASAVLAAFDDQIRRNARPEPGMRVERDEHVVRLVAADGGWSGVTWSDLTDVDADAEIAAQVSRFAELGQPWEWKHYSHDRPSDLPERLQAAGLVPDMAGPRVYDMAALLRGYQRARRTHRPILPVRLPGTAARALRAGANLAPDRAVGRRTWEDFLATRVSSPSDSSSGPT